MNTVQSTVGRGISANPTPQMAQNAAQPLSTADSRFSPNFGDLNEDVYEAQSHLLNAVDSFMIYGSPTEIINKMLFKWLTSPPLDLTKTTNQQELELVLRLVTFLEELRDTHAYVYEETKLLKSQKGGQADEQ